MPSQTFFNLDKEKQEKLISAAKQAFINFDYDNVSINQIIATANIPRGSFYMYFKNKDELFEYIINLEKKHLYDAIKNSFIVNNGDMYNSFKYLYEKIVDYILEKNYQTIFKNVFIYYDRYKNQFNKPGYLLYLEVASLINTDNLKDEELKFIFIMLLHHLFISITYAINNDCLLDKNQFIKKLNILCYGIYK